MAVQIITVVGTYLDAEGTPATGSVSFTPFLVAAEQDTPSMRTQLPVTTELDADGRFSVDLIASDDPSWYTNDNVPYVVQEDVAGDRGGWMTSLDFATYGPTVDITQLPPLGIVPEYYIPVPGPPNVLTVTGTHTIESGLNADVQISGTSARRRRWSSGFPRATPPRSRSRTPSPGRRARTRRLRTSTRAAMWPSSSPSPAATRATRATPAMPPRWMWAPPPPGTRARTRMS